MFHLLGSACYIIWLGFPMVQSQLHPIELNGQLGPNKGACLYLQSNDYLVTID